MENKLCQKKNHYAVLSAIVAVGIFLACSSDSSSGTSTSSCSTEKLPVSSLLFNNTEQGCVANQQMSFDDFALYMQDLGTAGFQTISSDIEGDSYKQVYNKSEGNISYSLHLTYTVSTNNITAVYLESSSGSSNPEPPMENVCVTAQTLLPDVEWRQSSQDTCFAPNVNSINLWDPWEEFNDSLGFVVDHSFAESWEYLNYNHYSRSLKGEGYVTSITKEIFQHYRDDETGMVVSYTFSRISVPLSNLGRVLVNYMTSNILSLSDVGATAAIKELDASASRSTCFDTPFPDRVSLDVAMQQAGFLMTWAPGEESDEYIFTASIEDGAYGTFVIDGTAKPQDEVFRICMLLTK